MFEHIHLPNPGITRGIIPEEIYKSVMQEVKEIERDDSGIFKMNASLAGQIEREYQLDKSKQHIVPFLEEMGREYQKNWDWEQDKDLEVESVWVNFQRKTEYNPLHKHDGVLSFVSWLEIPYKHEDERNLKQSRESKTKNGSATFQFVYNSVVGSIVQVPYLVENGWEGRIVMFPALLLHLVYPFFTSDRNRISIAGNLCTKK